MRLGFTLIELLVVMAVIALLLGLVLPTLSAARERSRAGVCLSNQHQLALAVEAYAADHDGRYPLAALPLSLCALLPASSSAAAQSWVTTLDPYASGDIQRVAHCPSDASPYFEVADPAADRPRLVSFGTNDWLTSGGALGRVDAVVQPAATVLAGELTERGSEYVVSDRFIERLWAPNPMDEYPLQIAHVRHDDRPHWLYADGHAAGDPVAQLRQPRAEEDDAWQVNRFRPEFAR